MSNWVDFRTLRERLDFVQVLAHYRVDIKRKGSQATAVCPLPLHKHNGPRPAPSFSVSLEKRIFQCFGCGGKGNVLDFIACMERLDPRNPSEFRKAALRAQQRFMPDGAPKTPTRVLPPRQTLANPVAPPKVPVPPSVGINEPLDFELKNLDPRPQYLLKRGFTERTIAHFGLGYCSKGLFAGRVVIPLHDATGRMIGYAGRLVFDEAVDDENPKYLFPAKRERNGRILEFAKSLFVYNGHRIQAPVHDLVIVQGFPAAWWLWQNGHCDVVSIMGDHCSVDQAKIIVDLVSPTGRVWLLTDGTKEGGRCAESLFFDIGPRRFCKWIKLRMGQPTDYDRNQLDKLLEWKIRA